MSAALSTAVMAMSDHAVQLRRAAVASLTAYGTIAGQYVEDTRLDDIPTGDMPRIIVRADEDFTGISQAGTDPQFRVRMNLMVECYAERAQKTDVVGDVDTMVAQVKDCLLGDPDFVSLSENIPEIKVRRIFRANAERFLGEGHLLFNLTWKEAYPPRVTQPLTTVTLTTNAAIVARPPPIGAIRFDGWYGDPTVPGSVAAQLAAALAPSQFQGRLPFFATITNGQVSWPVPNQATMDAEIYGATLGNLAFWAFDSYQPTDAESLALTLYLSSTLRSQLQFCMLGQISNWFASGGGFAPSVMRDIAMFAEPGYLHVSVPTTAPAWQPGPAAIPRPVYFVLGGGTASIEQQQMAIAMVRSQSLTRGTGNPYIIALSAAPLSQYDNVTGFAIPIGADAAGTYTEGVLNGAPQPYATLVTQAEQDWALRAASPLPMVPTACAGFDNTPFVVTPTPFYAGNLSSANTAQNYFQQGSDLQIANHIFDAMRFVGANPAACPAGIALIDAWNEYGEGAWIGPTYLAGLSGNFERVQQLGKVIPAPTNGQISLATQTVTLPS